MANMCNFLISLFILLFTVSTFGQTTSIPYSNNFDVLPQNSVGWSHYADVGNDDWEIGVPNDGIYFSDAYSLPNVWGTGLNNGFQGNSDRSLETPYFNLTDVSQHYAFSLYHKIRANSSGNQFKIEYKVGANGAWLLLDDAAMNKKNWQNATTFSSIYTSYRHSAIDLFFIQGQDSVKFRFRLNSLYPNGNGWMIDNFRIQPEYYNVHASQGDTIKGINKHFTNFTVNTEFLFNNQWSNYYNFQDEFYFSHDNILDAGDQLLITSNHSNNSTQNYNYTFPLPAGLSAGNYYIFYKYDVNDVLEEDDETDNTNFAVLVIDSIFSADYVEDFDTTLYKWNLAYDSSQSDWKRGDPNNWHVEDPRSGNNAWFSGEYGNLDSPYLDLSSSNNSVICWWYRNSKETGDPNFYLQLPSYGNAVVTFPDYYSLSLTQYNKLIPQTRFYGWDCHCEDISNYDGEISTQFRFRAFGNTEPNSLDQTLIDDVYIGSAKPDVAIGGERNNRFTSSSLAIDTLSYYLFNSGLGQLPSTTSTFYWSNDSIFDGGDILLGSQIEPIIDDTSFVLRKFIYTKPTLTEGEYFIIYVLDEGNIINEMREYDNIGFLRINQTFQPSLPYHNDFESTIDGWRHSSTLGNDDWECDVPSGVILDTAFSGTKAFCTNADGSTSLKSRMHLYSPVFDLTEVQHPVMEFDLKNWFYGYGYNYWPYNIGNMMYSVDGGNSWELLNTPSESYKLWYSKREYESSYGTESLTQTYTTFGEILYMKYAPIFKSHLSYQGRDYDDNTHYVIDLEHLKDEKEIQFMMVYANYDAPTEGMLLDNFEIKNKSIDLRIPSTKKLMVGSGDVELKTFFHVKNDENYLSDTTELRVYVSSDSILDGGDVLMQTQTIPAIRPYEKHLVNLVMDVPPNYGQFNYLIYEIDPNNIVNEINEINNIGYLELAMDSSENYEYPILFDFNDIEVDGWTWWHDSTGYRHGHRFRNQTVINDNIFFPEDGVWFLDMQSNNYSSHPTHHLEPPTFDFSKLSTAEMTFDYKSGGSNGSGFNTQGGNLSYSIDGGQTWIVLDYAQDQYAQNWYHLTELESLNNEPGWGYEENWTTAKYNLSFLCGESNVRFRFNWRGVNLGGMHGFRLDNFKIDGKYNDLIASNIHPVLTLNSILEPSFQMEYEIENSGLNDILLSETSFYWSNDTILDNGDSLIYVIPESVFQANSINTILQTIYYPKPISDTTYYILYFTDSDSTVNELNETNNLGWWRIDFTDSLFVDLTSIPLVSPVYAVAYSDYFYFEFEYKNVGNLPSDSAIVSIHWSLDTLLNVGDVLLYDIEEPDLIGTDFIRHAGNVYFPHPISEAEYYLLISTDVNNNVIENNENNNFIWVKVNLDTTGLGINEVGKNSTFKFIPGQDNLEIIYKGVESGKAKLAIRDMYGQIIYSEESYLNSEDKWVVKRPIISAGKYFLLIQKGNEYYVFNFAHYKNN